MQGVEIDVPSSPSLALSDETDPSFVRNETDWDDPSLPTDDCDNSGDSDDEDDPRPQGLRTLVTKLVPGHPFTIRGPLTRAEMLSARELVIDADNARLGRLGTDTVTRWLNGASLPYVDTITVKAERGPDGDAAGGDTLPKLLAHAVRVAGPYLQHVKLDIHRRAFHHPYLRPLAQAMQSRRLRLQSATIRGLSGETPSAGGTNWLEIIERSVDKLTHDN